GTGNITGIATAVAIGGVGSLFWMWVVALLGMATAYSETLLSIKYRSQNAEGAMSGGPMYTLLNGVGSKRLAQSFAFLASIAVIGTGCMVQAHSVTDAIRDVWADYWWADRWIIGVVLAVLVGSVILGGVKSIGKVAGVLVPFMASLYLLAGIFVLLYHYQNITSAFSEIIKSAFSGQAAAGGFMGSTVMLAVRMGVARGLFSNEAGLGSLPIAAASSQIKHPAQQGLLSVAGVFISTMLVCTITGLVLAVTNVLPTGKTGSCLAMAAFSSVMPEFKFVVLGGLILFAFTTILAWEYYGEKCIEFLFGLKAAHYYRWVYVLMAVLGASVEDLKIIWNFADIANALMAIPNLLSILLLSKIVKAESVKSKLL
ncbi:MAG: alanine/glycine:cation symporter family protein, partial [Gammaproteobacteria bacterium]